MFPWVRGREQRTAEENKATIHRINVELWQGNLAILDELTTPGFYDRIAGASSGIEQTKRDVAAVLAAFPDLQLASQDLIAEGDKVAGHYVLRGYPSKPALRYPALRPPSNFQYGYHLPHVRWQNNRAVGTGRPEAETGGGLTPDSLWR